MNLIFILFGLSRALVILSTYSTSDGVMPKYSDYLQISTLTITIPNTINDYILEYIDVIKLY